VKPMRRDVRDRGAAIEAVMRPATSRIVTIAARKTDRLAMPLHLHRRAPLVRIPHQHPNGGGADAGVAELVSAPGIGGEHALQSRVRPDHGVRETAGRRGQHRRSAAAVSLRADPRWIDPGSVASTFHAASTS